jgi:glycosyltransferase involved in cell wall biosynthesis
MKRVLFQSRSNLFSISGGDTIQLLKTAEYLRKEGYHIDISTELNPNLEHYDFVHVFNLMQPVETYQQALNAKRYGKKVILSTIYGPWSENDKIEIGGIRKIKEGVRTILIKLLRPSRFMYLIILVRAIIKFDLSNTTLTVLTKGLRTLQARIIQMADLLLPNSMSELQKVKNDFTDADGKICVVVPNAVDTDLFNPDSTAISVDVEKYKGCILCVARIERGKCQLNLVRATRYLPWPLLLIGSPGINCEYYFEQAKREGSSNVFFLGQISHEILPQYYKVAKVHVLISWMETTGISSLEAAAMGCNIVVTKKGYTRDYFGDYAFYCDPDSIESIRDAIVRAYETPVNPHLREYVLNNYTWEKAASKTIEGYQQI